MKYIFPRQFKLHNVFTSKADDRETAHKLKDYTLRDREIAAAELECQRQHGAKRSRLKIPMRLRGAALSLVTKMQTLHSRCWYVKLLEYYCPTCPSGSRGTGDMSGRDLVDAATPLAQVSAFCRAALARLLPKEFLGLGNGGERNWYVLMCSVDRFVRFRRYENANLHAVCQGIRLSCVAWLDAPNLGPSSERSWSDTCKRQELFHELLYYVFDSILISLLRSNFYITESSTHKYRLFYFRHDVWKLVTDPSLSTLQCTIFDEVPRAKAKKILDAQQSSHVEVRLIPKGTGVRPIMNLKRRVVTTRNGKAVLGKSINHHLKPIQSMLTYEKVHQPDQLGSSLFCVADLFPKLKDFKTRLDRPQMANVKFYFVKVDVQACFDTIPQREVLDLVEQLCSESEYRFFQHAQVNLNGNRGSRIKPVGKAGVNQKYLTSARAGHSVESFENLVDADFAIGRRRMVFVEKSNPWIGDKGRLVRRLRDHVERNIVRIGNKYHRQREGIPQGSVVSSLLCSFFYAEFERNRLGFLDTGDNLLLRLIDDFLLITTDRAQAQRFMQTMSQGSEAYGIRVRTEKSLVNFEYSINGIDVPRTHGVDWFPYCGTMIDTSTLDITKDRERWPDRSRAMIFKCKSMPRLTRTQHSQTHLLLNHPRRQGRCSAARLWRTAFPSRTISRR